MFNLKDAAGAQLHKSLATAEMPDNEGKCFRIVPKDDKFLTMQFARPAPGDETFEHEGAVVLAIPKALRLFSRNMSLDIDQSGKLKLI